MSVSQAGVYSTVEIFNNSINSANDFNLSINGGGNNGMVLGIIPPESLFVQVFFKVYTYTYIAPPDCHVFQQRVDNATTYDYMCQAHIGGKPTAALPWQIGYQLSFFPQPAMATIGLDVSGPLTVTGSGYTFIGGSGAGSDASVSTQAVNLSRQGLLLFGTPSAAGATTGVVTAVARLPG